MRLEFSFNDSPVVGEREIVFVALGEPSYDRLELREMMIGARKGLVFVFYGRVAAPRVDGAEIYTGT